MKRGASSPRWLTFSFGAVGFGFASYLIIQAWTKGELTSTGTRWPLIWTVGAAIVAAVASSISWASLVGGPKLTPILQYLVIQLSKYGPGGGLLHAVGQIAASSPTKSRPQVTALYGSHALIHLTSAVSVGLLYGSLVWTVIWPLRVVAVAFIVLAMILCSAGLRLLLVRLSTSARLSRFGSRDVQLSDLRASLAWAFIATVSGGFGFWNVYRFFDSHVSFLAAVSLFAVAWAVGFIAIPFPAGLGVREAALSFLGLGLPGVVAAASILQRVLALAGDLVVGLVATLVMTYETRRFRTSGESKETARRE